MESKIASVYYRLELDDYSAAAFTIKPDPDYKEFCNDIFGDG